MSNPYDLIIIGGGPAGLAAGIYAMRAVLKAVLVEMASPGGQVAITKGVENYPGFEDISGFDLSDRFLQHAMSYGLEVIRDQVVSVETGDGFHTVRLDGGKTLEGIAVIMATGGTPRKLGIPGEIEYFGRGVSYCAKCDGFFFKDKVVVVIGGGDTATEEGLYLAKLARKVYLIHRRDSLRASRLLQQRVQADCKINLLLNSSVSEIKGDSSGATGVVVKNKVTGEEVEIPADGVFIFIGLSPNNHLVPSGINVD
ncbi:MAG: NAD(P)/FAD-dependent oxidoreductase, partial [Acidobacteriota bacterium]